MFKKQEIPVPNKVQQLEAAVKKALAERDQYKREAEEQREYHQFYRAERDRLNVQHRNLLQQNEKLRQERDMVIQDFLRIQPGADRVQRVGGDADDQLFREDPNIAPALRKVKPRFYADPFGDQQRYGQLQQQAARPEPPAYPMHAPKPIKPHPANYADMHEWMVAHDKWMHAVMRWEQREGEHQRLMQERAMNRVVVDDMAAMADLRGDPRPVNPAGAGLRQGDRVQVHAADREAGRWLDPPNEPLNGIPAAIVADGVNQLAARAEEVVWNVIQQQQAGDNFAMAEQQVHLPPVNDDDDEDDYDPGDEADDYEQPEL